MSTEVAKPGSTRTARPVELSPVAPTSPERTRTTRRNLLAALGFGSSALAINAIHPPGVRAQEAPQAPDALQALRFKTNEVKAGEDSQDVQTADANNSANEKTDLLAPQSRKVEFLQNTPTFVLNNPQAVEALDSILIENASEIRIKENPSLRRGLTPQTYTKFVDPRDSKNPNAETFFYGQREVIMEPLDPKSPEGEQKKVIVLNFKLGEQYSPSSEYQRNEIARAINSDIISGILQAKYGPVYDPNSKEAFELQDRLFITKDPPLALMQASTST